MNIVNLSGRLIKDSELSYLPGNGTAKLNFCIAVERNYQKDKSNKKSDFINCEMLGKGAEALSNYLEKGKPIIVIGELNIDQYEKDGEKKSYTKVKVDRVEFQQGQSNQSDKVNSNNSFEPVDDSDIPF